MSDQTLEDIVDHVYSLGLTDGEGEPYFNDPRKETIAALTEWSDKRVVAELQSVWDEGYQRWNDAPRADKHSQTQHVSKALFDRINQRKQV